MTARWAPVLAALLLAGSPLAAEAQVFVASRPHPRFTVGPLFIRAHVGLEPGPTPVDVFWTLAVPPAMSATEVEQDLYLLWPGEVVPDPEAGPPDPALAREVQAMGMAVIAEGRVAMTARDLYRREPDGRSRRVTIPGGAAFVSFVREGGGLGLSAPATWVRIPWTPASANRTWVVGLRLTTRDLVKPEAATWAERTLRGERHRVTVSFGDVRQHAMFPLYFGYRNRVIDLADEPSQLQVEFAHADRLQIDELTPADAQRRRSEIRENAEVVSVFLQPGKGLRPQILGVKFGYFWGLQAWAPVLFAALFFLLGNMAAPLIRLGVEWGIRNAGARFDFGRGDATRPRAAGVIVTPDTLRRIIPGETPLEEVLRLCGRDPEEHERLGDPTSKRLVYRGRRAVPRRRRSFGWVATVNGWDVEDQEVEIAVEHGVVRDIQARVRRTHPSRPDAG